MEVYNQNYRLEEMKDSMEESLSNLTNIIENQKKLIDVVNSSTKAIEFADFIKGLVEQVGNYENQSIKLKLKIDLLCEIIEANKDETLGNHCAKILSLLGVFNDSTEE